MVPDGRPTDAAIVEALRALAGEKVGKTFCPSEAAKRVAEDWRPLMPRVRALAAAVGLTATQKGVPVDPIKARGPIRLSR
ncbi:MAG: DUF3253 domain-containing protein [Pseudomonadota bacterium]